MKNLRIVERRKSAGDVYGTGDQHSYIVFDVVRDFDASDIWDKERKRGDDPAAYFTKELLEKGNVITTASTQEFAQYILNGLKPKGTAPESPWDFVAEYYPKYSSCDEIARADDLQKILDEEEEQDDAADQLFQREYSGDREHPMLQADYNTLHMKIYEKAIKGYIDSLKVN